MGLFVRRSTESSEQPLYSNGHKRTVLIVGLGNIGKKYEGTRHNIGFTTIDAYKAQAGFPEWQLKKDLKCHVTTLSNTDTQIVLIKPTTFMNESGQAVQAVQHFYKITNSSTLVIHDELDIPFGQVRTRVGGSSAGNNGIASLISHIGEEFARIRIGIKNEHADATDSADFVLKKFSGVEQAKLPELKREVSALISEYLATNELPPDTRNFLL